MLAYSRQYCWVWDLAIERDWPGCCSGVSARLLCHHIWWVKGPLKKDTNRGSHACRCVALGLEAARKTSRAGRHPEAALGVEISLRANKEGGHNASCGDMGFLMHPMLGRGTAWSALLAALLILLSSQQAAAQKSVPVTTTQDFAQALQDQTITEIILDPSGTGVRPSPIPASAEKRVL